MADRGGMWRSVAVVALAGLALALVTPASAAPSRSSQNPAEGGTDSTRSDEGPPEVGAISGTVVSALDGAPVAGVCVSAVGDENAPELGVTDESGAYVLAGLASGEYLVRFDRCGPSTDDDDSGLIVPPSRQVTVEAPGVVDGVDARLIGGTDEPTVPSDGPPSVSSSGEDLPEVGAISGSVVSGVDGAPVSGVCVSAVGDEIAPVLGVTDESGGYMLGGLESGDYTVDFDLCAASGDGGEPMGLVVPPSRQVTVESPGLTDDVDAEVAPPFEGGADGTERQPTSSAGDGRITGTVTADTGGAPLDWICVYAYDPATGAFHNTYTGADGAFDLDGLASGSYRLQFHDCFAGDFVTEWFDDTYSWWSVTLVSVTAGQTTSGINAGLASAGHISGIVTADDGAGSLDGICVSAQDPATDAYSSDVTGPDGSYDVGGLPSGSYKLTFMDCYNGDYLTEHFDDTRDYGTAVMVSVTEGMTTSGIDASLAGAGHIAGRVTADMGGAPLVGVCAAAALENTNHGFSVGTGPDGTFDIYGLVPGSYVVYFGDCSHRGYVGEYFDDTYSFGAATLVTVTAGQTTSGIDAGLADGGYITGTVTADGDGAPLEEICVDAYDPATDAGSSAVTGPDGTYEINLLTGSYRVSFRDCLGGSYLAEYFDDTYDIGSMTPVAVTAEQTASGIDAGMALGGRITGTVTADAGGAPLQGICVYSYYLDSGTSGFSYTGLDGTYDIGPLRSGSYRVQFYDCSSGGYFDEWFDDTYDSGSATPVAVTAGLTTSGIDAGLSDGDHITGTVTADTGGAPLEDICVSAYNSATGVYRSDATGPDGTYDVDGLPPGSYRVWFSDCSGGGYLSEYFDDTYDYGSATLVAVIAGQTTAGIDAGLAEGGRITGTVTADSGGAPLDDICVYAYDPSTDAEGYGSTGPDGTFDMGGLPTGSYRVNYRSCSGGVYLSEWFDDTYAFGSATAVAVTTGQTTSGVDAALALAGRIAGTVTADSGGAPLEYICVSAYDPDTNAEGYGSTGPDGIYDLGGLPSGSYLVRFSDCFGGDYLSEWFDNTNSLGSATLVAVTLGQTTSSIDAGLAEGGRITGTVTADAGGAPLEDICVYAVDPDGDGYSYGYGSTGPSGTFDIGGLPTGTYEVRFDDCWGGGFLSEWYDDAYSVGSATLVAVTAAQTTSGIDAGLTVEGHIDGTVVDSVSGQPVPGAFVAVLRTNDFSIAASAVADGSGSFSVSVPPGGYFAYLIDPSATHTAGFSVGDPLVTVPAGTVVDADLAMAPLRGAISGTVTEEGTGDPVANALVFSLTNGGDAEIATVADNNGDYTLGGLRTGNHYVAFADPAGNHRSEFWPNSLNVPDATTLAVTAGGTTVADSALATQTGTSTGSLLTGTIVQTGTLDPLEDVVVLALHATDFRLARAAATNAAGQYSLDVQAGLGYKLAFYDGTGLHGFEWHDNQPNTGLGTATTVVAPAATNASLDNLTGTQTGTITDQTYGDPINGAWVFAIGQSGIAGGAVTAPDGTYTIAGLAPGTYRATFVDPNGGRAQEYYQNSPDYDGATTFNITAGTTTPNINAAMDQP